MSAESRRRFNQQVYEEASDWFVRFRTGVVDEPARREFDQCLRSSPEFMRAYLELTAIWNEGERLDADKRWDSEALIAQARAAADEVIPLSSARPPESRGDEEEPVSARSDAQLRHRRRWSHWTVGAGLAAAAAAAL